MRIHFTQNHHFVPSFILILMPIYLTFSNKIYYYFFNFIWPTILVSILLPLFKLPSLPFSHQFSLILFLAYLISLPSIENLSTFFYSLLKNNKWPNEMRVPFPTRKLKSLFYGFTIFLFVVFLIWFEETRIGIFTNIYGNYYKNVIFRPIKVQRKDLQNPLNIWVILVVSNAAQLSQYPMAQFTLRCYCSLQGYSLKVIDLSKDESIPEKCPQTDFMFLRHCALANFLAIHPDIEFVLFLDADMGIINPNHLLEEFTGPIVNDDQMVEMIFYERTFNGEIMAGSYFLRNSIFARQFLFNWANYQFRMPPNVGKWNFGTDNAAIHAVFLNLFCGQNCSDQRRICHQFWNSSTTFSNLAQFTACAKNILGSRNIFHSINGNASVLLLTDHKKYWARDGWLTSNLWSPRDFIVHGWQKWRLNQPIFAGWHSPLEFSTKIQQNSSISSCSKPEIAHQNWPYKDTFMKGEEEIWEKMDKIGRQRKAEMLDLLKSIML